MSNVVQLAVVLIPMSVLVQSGCGNSSACAPGQSVACTCDDGRMGAQSCNDENMFGPCTCTGGDGVDMAAPPDLALPDPDLAQPPAPDMATAAPDMTPMQVDMACVAIPNAKRIFVTSQGTTGNLKANGNGTTGLEGGDKLCQNAADAASLNGTFKAWLSSSSENAIDRVADVGPWYFVDRCTMVFMNKAAITANGPLTDINRTAKGALAPPLNLWTGTKATGVKDSFTCNDWTNDQPIHGYEGTIGVGSNFFFDGAWTETASNPCSGNGLLICFEQ